MSITSRYGVDGPGSNPGGIGIFRAIQTNPEAHLTSDTMVTECFPGAERLKHGDDRPPPSSAEVRLGSSCTSAMSWGDLNLLTLNLPTTTIVAQPFLMFC
jgi:hypothetical protein